MTVRRHIYFSGQVQGVGFRYSAKSLARPLGLTGWIRNLWDGRVEMEVQGEEAAIKKMLVQLRYRRFIRVTGMEVEELPVVPREREFSVSDY